MNEENKTEAEADSKLDDIQLAAIVSSTVFIVWFAVYWFFQIQAVRELFEFVNSNNF
jgi:hypothetical protein